jgi:hypothetical protein
MRLAAALNGWARAANKAFAKLLHQLGEGRRQENDFAVIKLNKVNIVLCESTTSMMSL